MNVNIWQEIGIVVIAYFVVCLVFGLRGHRLKTRMKQFGNGIVGIGGIILTMYIIMFGIMLVPKVLVLVRDLLSGADFGADTVLILRGLPLAFIIVLFIGAIWFLKRVFSCNLFKFNDAEKQFIKSENEKMLLGIRKFFKIKEKEKKEEKKKL